MCVFVFMCARKKIMKMSFRTGLKYYLILLFYYNSLCNYDGVETITVADSWIKMLSVASGYLVNCTTSTTNSEQTTLIPWQCIRNGSMRIFDQITECDVIPLMDNMRLKRYRQNQNNLIPKSFVDFRTNDKKLSYTTPYASTIESWSHHILKRFVNTLNTHVLEIDLVESNMASEARRRRHQMLPMMIFGITAFGMVIVPIGFQFLAVVAGKALLLAKMALLLSSINGLKRVFYIN